MQGIASMTPLLVQGSLEHDSAETGNPLSLGITAVAHGADPTAVAAGDRTRWYGNRDGVPYVIGGQRTDRALVGSLID